MASAAPPETLNEDIPQNDSGKLRTFIGILRRFIGVADLAAVRFSLPSQLLEPRPNLEYWTYLDVPNAFAAIGTAEEPVDRMLEVLRFWFTKDLKYVKGKPCKPYNFMSRRVLPVYLGCREQRAPDQLALGVGRCR
ncbi:Oxysterol-binding protein [Apiospora arundinis]